MVLSVPAFNYWIRNLQLLLLYRLKVHPTPTWKVLYSLVVNKLDSPLDSMQCT